MPNDIEIPPPGYRVSRRRAGTDPTTRRLGLIAAGIGGVLIVVVGLWSMLGGRTSGVPVVTPPPGPMRVKPANPGGMHVAGLNEPILSGAHPSGQAALVPPPETPDLAALRNPPAPQPAPPATTEAANPAAPSATTEKAVTTPPAAVTEDAANGLPFPPPAAPPLRLAAASMAPPLPRNVGTGAATEVQLAAMNSQSSASREWQDLRAAMPGLFDHRQPLITKVEIDGHTFWRLRTGGFANIAEATQFCATLRAKGRGCTIASF